MEYEILNHYWIKTYYAFDIDRNLKEKEIFGRKISFKSPQLRYRNKLLDWLKSVAEKLSLSNVTVHLGVFLMDKFMDNHNILITRLASVGLICLILAAKFEEQDWRIPKLSDLLPLVGNGMDISELVQLEVFVLHAFDWRIFWPTPAHFAEFYSQFTVVPGDKDCAFTSVRHLRDLVTSSLRDYLDITLSDIMLLKYPASEVAAACLLAARLEHGVRPVWPKCLESTTGYSVSKLQPVFNIIIDADASLRRKRKFEETHESGYESSSPDNLAQKIKF